MNALSDLIASQLAGISQADRLVRLHTPLGTDALLPERLTGFEAVSEAAGYRFELTALATDAHIELNQLIGQPILVELLTADSRSDLRPWHGYVTAFELVGSNQGIARYKLTIEPWLAFFACQTNSHIFQNQSVIDTVEAVIGRYQNQGALAPAWRWELSDKGLYPQRSVVTQYRETDLAFIQRQLAHHGLFYWFEHSGNPNDDALGSHTLVISDNNDAFTPGTAIPIRFQRADATEKEDSIQTWRINQRRNSPDIRLNSWDYRTRSARDVSAAGNAVPVALAADDTPGHYSYSSREYGQRLADLQHEAWAARELTYSGSGVHRRLAPGQRFALVGHPLQQQDCLCLRVSHKIKNNLSAEVFAEAERALGPGVGNREQFPAAWPRSQSSDAGFRQWPGDTNSSRLDEASSSEDDFYKNDFNAMPASTPYRPALSDGHGIQLHPRPTIRATQTAIVVGPQGAPVYTDRDHRIKIQFHWQRGARAHNQLDSPDGQDNAPGNETVGAWVRVATAVAGNNWGSNFVPRVGQEVLVTFIEGDIDRPMVTGALYNGQGQTDAQNNQINASVGAATANAPAWFAGETGGHAHPASLSGFKTQALSTSQDGTGGYNQLVFDDTPGQLRTLLSTTQYATALALGHLKQQNDNQRLNNRGHGAELTTEAFGSVRAGQGLLLTTEPGGQQLSADGAVSGITQAKSLIQSLADTAEAQQAIVDGDPKAKDLSTLKALSDTEESINTTGAGSGTGSTSQDQPIKTTLGGAGDVPAWARPDLILSATAGIAALTPKDHILATGNTLSLTAQDINLLTQNESSAAVALGIRLFTHGHVANADKPNQEIGIALHAASGKVTAQAQSAQAKLAAQKSVTFASTNANAEISAMKHILLNAAGAGLQMQGANITLTAPGPVTFMAKQHVLTAGQGTSADQMSFPAPTELKNCEYRIAGAEASSEALVAIDA